MATSFSSSQQPFHFSGIQTRWNVLCSEREKKVFSKVGVGIRGQQGKKSKENREFWVLRHHPRDQEILAAPGLCKSAFAQQEVGPGGIFSNPSHYFKGKFTSSTKRLVAPSDKRIALGRADGASCFSHQAAGWGGGKWENDRIQGWPE